MLSYKTQGLVGWLGAGVPPTLGTQALLKSKRYWRMNVVSCNLVRSSWMATSLLTQCLFQGWALGARSTSAMCPCVNRGFGTAHPNKTEFKADLDLTPPLPSRRIETTLFCTYTGRHVYTLCLQLSQLHWAKPKATKAPPALLHQQLTNSGLAMVPIRMAMPGVPVVCCLFFKTGLHPTWWSVRSHPRMTRLSSWPIMSAWEHIQDRPGNHLWHAARCMC